MIKALVANGCSYTRGAELVDPEREAWPAALGRRLGVPWTNLASDGGSNRRMIRTTIENLERVRSKFGVRYDELLVVLMWTGMARSEYHHPRRLDIGNRPRLPGEPNWHRLGRWRIEENDPASEAFFRFLWDEVGAVTGFLVDWIGLDAYIQGRGARVAYVYAWDVLPKRLSDEVRELARLLPANAVYGGKPLSSRNSFYEDIHQRFETGKLYHPLAPAHDYFAHELADWLRLNGTVQGD